MALEIFKLIGSVFVDTAAADESLQKTDKNAEGVGSKLVSAATSAGKFALGVVGAAAAAGTALVAVAENTREYRTEQGKLQAAFETSGFSAETARATYSALNGVLGDSGQAVEAANHLALLATNEQDLATWTNICTGVYATFGDSLPIEGLTEAANETAKTGAVTGGLADALNWVSLGSEGWRAALGSNEKALNAFSAASKSGATNEDAFNAALAACTTEQERQALIMATLQTAYGDASTAYQTMNADVIAANVAQDNLNNAMAGIGAAVEPFITLGKQLLADVLAKLTPLLTSLGATIIPALTSAFSYITGIVIPPLTAALDWITVNVLPPLASAFSTLTDWLGTTSETLTSSGVTFDTVMATVQSLFSGAMDVISTAWTSVGQPIWDLVMQYIGMVRDLFQQNMPAIRTFVAQAFSDIKRIWEQNLKPALDAIGQFINNVLAPAFKFVFQTIIAPVVSNAFRTIQSLWHNSLKPVLQGILDFISGVFSGDFKKAWSGLVEALGGIWGGIKTMIKAPLNSVISILNSFIGKINRLEIPDWVPGIGGKGLDIKTIPYLEKGGVLERGQVGFLEGTGAEAVVPLHKNKAWTQAVARDMDAAMGGASSKQITAVLLDILAAIEASNDRNVYLDTGALVGGLAKPLDRKLGQLQVAKGRV